MSVRGAEVDGMRGAGEVAGDEDADEFDDEDGDKGDVTDEDEGEGGEEELELATPRNMRS